MQGCNTNPLSLKDLLKTRFRWISLLPLLSLVLASAGCILNIFEPIQPTKMVTFTPFTLADCDHAYNNLLSPDGKLTEAGPYHIYCVYDSESGFKGDLFMDLYYYTSTTMATTEYQKRYKSMADDAKRDNMEIMEETDDAYRIFYSTQGSQDPFPITDFEAVELYKDHFLAYIKWGSSSWSENDARVWSADLPAWLEQIAENHIK